MNLNYINKFQRESDGSDPYCGTPSTPTGERIEKEIGFGDYVTIEMKRFGCPNEFYTYKVIGRLNSNSWIDVPAITHKGATIHDTIEDVLNCVCEGVGEDRFERYRVCDVKLHPKSKPITHLPTTVSAREVAAAAWEACERHRDELAKFEYATKGARFQFRHPNKEQYLSSIEPKK